MKKIFWQRKFLGGMVVSAIALSLLAGCGKKDDPITQAEKKDATKGIAAPSIAETKAIAEEGFIYGLPIVMNYALVLAEDGVAVDPASRRGHVAAARLGAGKVIGKSVAGRWRTT